MLATWKDVLESPEVPVRQTRMIYAVNRSVENVLRKLSTAARIGQLDLQFSQGWNETTDFNRGYFKKTWGIPDSWAAVILQGPHLHVATPLSKSPNATMRNNLDWSETDFEALPDNAIPATSYKPAGPRARYDADYTSWQVTGGDGIVQTVHARGCYRIAWRAMAANTGERTLIPAVIPPGAGHVFTIYSLASPTEALTALVLTAACFSSLLSDMNVRTAPKHHIIYSTINRLPLVEQPALGRSLILRALRLNCVTNAYADLWHECFGPAMQSVSWAGGSDHARRQPLGSIGPEWIHDTPLRVAADRRQALVEIDALVALGLGLTADELCTVYRTQFPVLYGYDRNTYLYDSNGRLVPYEVVSVWRKKGGDLTVEERTGTNQAGNTYTYEPPFGFLDREADMRAAYAEFASRLNDE